MVHYSSIIVGHFLIAKNNPPTENVLEIAKATGGNQELVDIYKEEYRNVVEGAQFCIFSWLGTGLVLGTLLFMVAIR